MNTCKNCTHWSEGVCYLAEIRFDPQNELEEQDQFVVRVKKGFCDAGVNEGFDCWFEPGPEFGCIRHKAIPVDWSLLIPGEEGK